MTPDAPLVIAIDRGTARVLAVAIALVSLGIAAFFVVMATRGAINPEAWICVLGLVPIGATAIALATRTERIEVDADGLRLVRATLGRSRVTTLPSITAVRIDRLGGQTRVAVVDAAGIAHVLFLRADAATDARAIAARLGVRIDER